MMEEKNGALVFLIFVFSRKVSFLDGRKRSSVILETKNKINITCLHQCEEDLFFDKP